MAIKRPYIPKEVDADVATSIIIPFIDDNTGGKVTYVYDFKGVSERTALGDVLTTSIKNKLNSNTSVTFSLKRDSLYHILPEYLFHPLDRYLGADGDTEEFEKRYKEQDEQEKNALTYFRPFDKHFQELRTKHQKWLNDNIFNGSQFISDYLTSGYKFNRSNPFIQAVYPCIPWLRNNRGNLDMIKSALGYSFRGKATIQRKWKEENMPLSESVPSNVGGLIDNLFLGSTHSCGSYNWHVIYQTEIENEDSLDKLKRLVRAFEDFFSDWFLLIEETLTIEFGDWTAKPELTIKNQETGIFLNYSTQLI